MRFRKSAIALGLLLTIAAILPAAAAETQPVVPTDHGNSVGALLYARPFTLEKAYTYTYTKEQPKITSGYILVVSVDKELALPRNTWTPVIYVGTRPAQVTNLSVESGRLVLLVPGDTDLSKDPAYFGSVQLPEDVDAARGAQELAAAQKLGIHPFPAETVSAALAAGGPALHGVGSNDVFRAIAGVLDTYVPEDHGVAQGYLQLKAGE